MSDNSSCIAVDLGKANWEKAFIWQLWFIGISKVFWKNLWAFSKMSLKNVNNIVNSASVKMGQRTRFNRLKVLLQINQNHQELACGKRNGKAKHKIRAGGCVTPLHCFLGLSHYANLTSHISWWKMVAPASPFLHKPYRKCLIQSVCGAA